MAAKLNARVMVKDATGEETHVDFYVRAVTKGENPLRPSDGVDAWAAYSERGEWVRLKDDRRVWLGVTSRESDAPRLTIEEAAADMYRALRALGGRLVSGEVPEQDSAILLGADPMGAEVKFFGDVTPASHEPRLRRAVLQDDGVYRWLNDEGKWVKIDPASLRDTEAEALSDARALSRGYGKRR